jgi:hypothetical protein
MAEVIVAATISPKFFNSAAGKRSSSSRRLVKAWSV